MKEVQQQFERAVRGVSPPPVPGQGADEREDGDKYEHHTEGDDYEHGDLNGGDGAGAHHACFACRGIELVSHGTILVRLMRGVVRTGRNPNAERSGHRRGRPVRSGAVVGIVGAPTK